MRVAHIAVATPKRCGLYETTRDLVVGLRDLDVDSRIVDPTKATNALYPKTPDDRGAPLADLDFALSADVLVNHSGLGKELEDSKAPIVHVAHGRPRSSFVTEANGGTPIYSYHYAKNNDPRFRSIVTFWPEHIPYLQVMFPSKSVVHVQAPVDLDRWTPDGARGYDFHGKRGRINVVCADPWRDDVDPFTAVNAFALWAREVPGARLHVYGAPANLRGWAALFQRLRDDGNMGEICRWVDGLDHVYRAADLALTANAIATRSVREAMACGCPVARVAGAVLNGFREDFRAALSTPRYEVRQKAEEQFDSRETAKQFKAVLEAAWRES